MQIHQATLAPTLAPIPPQTSTAQKTPNSSTIASACTTTCNTIIQLAKKIFSPLFCLFDAIDNKLEELRQTLHSGCMHLTSNLLPVYVVLPAINSYSPGDVRVKTESLKDAFEKIRAQHTNTSCEQVELSINEKVTLEGIQLIHDKTVEARERKVIVVFSPNNQIWQYSFDFLKDLFNETGHDVVCYNYRATGLSGGLPQSEDTLIQDGQKVVEKLIKDGHLPKNITLYGKSLGALVAGHVAAKVSDDYGPVQTALVCCPKNIQAAISHIVPYIGNKVAELAGAFHWKFDMDQVLGKLQGKLVVIYNDTDTTILPPAIAINKDALEKLLGECKLQSIQYISMDDAKFAEENPEVAKKPYCNGHYRPFSKGEMEQVVTAIKS